MNPLSGDFKIGPAVGEILPSLTKETQKGGESGSVPFKDMLKGLVDQVDTLQKKADASIEGLVTGETTNVHNVMIKMEEAGIAFDLMMKVRDKLVEAYKEVSRMQA